MVPERIHDARDAPTVLIADWPHDGSASGDRPFEGSIRIGHLITIRTIPPPSDSGLKLKDSGDSSASQNSALPMHSSTATAGTTL